MVKLPFFHHENEVHFRRSENVSVIVARASKLEGAPDDAAIESARRIAESLNITSAMGDDVTVKIMADIVADLERQEAEATEQNTDQPS